MRILIISNSFWSVYNFRASFIKEFIKNKNQVLISSIKDKSLNRLKNLGAKIKEIKIISKSTNPLNEIKLLFELKKLFINYRPNIVINFTIKPILYSSFLLNDPKVKVINTLDGFGLSLTKNFFFKKLIFFFFKISQKNIFKFYAVTNKDYKYLKLKKLIPEKKLFLINGTGVNLKHYRYIKPVFKKNTKFVFIGRFLELKGIRLFVKASEIIKKKYPYIEFLAVGSVSSDKYSINKEELKEWKKKKIIKFINHVSDIRKILKISDCVVLPTTYPEGLNRSLLEAIATGRPAITNRIGGCEQIIKNNYNGYIKKIKNEFDLADIMIKYHKLSNKKKKIFSLNGRKYAEKYFDEKKIIRKYLTDINEKI